jgi:hypothetical protein
MKKICVCLAAALISFGVLGDTKPFNISITPDMAIYGRTTTIEGVTLSIWGENPQTSLALGIINGSVGDSAGLDWALILNYADDYKGVQWAPINYTKHDSLGWDGGFINYTGGLMTGLLTGAVNVSQKLRGVQFGFVNYVETTDAGVQIGFINIIRSNRQWFANLPTELAPVMIFVNWGM